MALSEDLGRIAVRAAAFSEPGEELAGILAAEPGGGERIYLCAFCRRPGETSWLALDGEGRPVESRSVLRDAVSIAAMCELAEENAAGGDLDELRARLVALRLTENPPGIDQADEAVLGLQRAIARQPRLATLAYLDSVGGATRRLEQALGDEAESPFALAMKQGMALVESLTKEVEANYKRALA